MYLSTVNYVLIFCLLSALSGIIKAKFESKFVTVNFFFTEFFFADGLVFSRINEHFQNLMNKKRYTSLRASATSLYTIVS